MSHITLNINWPEVMAAEPIKPNQSLTYLLRALVMAGAFAFLFDLFYFPDHARLAWGSFFVNVIFWMGVAMGSIIICATFQIVRAQWSPPVRRFAEANVAYLPYAWISLMLTYFGKEELFSWGKASRPLAGREWWMQPDFVYARFAVLFFLLFWMMARFVRLSLRGDIGLLREKMAGRSAWKGWWYDYLTKNWKGADKEILPLHQKLSFNAPILLAVYAVVVSLFAFEMVMGMNGVWISNLYGAFTFTGFVYTGWAMLSLSVLYHAGRSAVYERTLDRQQLWDLGKLCLGFCMLWGYMFFSQFLPQWYGNLPEETQWMILRTRDFPWKTLGWLTFAFCFIIPFILLLSEDLKKTPKALATVALIILAGVWLEKYVTVMPEVSPQGYRFSITDVGIFVVFMGTYFLSIQTYLSKVPFIPVSHPLSHCSKEW